MDIEISVQNTNLRGILELPRDVKSLVIFAHGSGSGRLSERNTLVALGLQKVGIATLLVDLLTEEEDKISSNRFDVELLTERLIALTKWCMEDDRTKQLKIGYYGSSTGAAAALSAAAYWGTKIRAVVSRGGRPDLAMDVLDLIEAPCLFIVGGDDKQVLAFNKQAYQKMGCVKKIEVISGATHLFEEFGAMEKVSELTRLWFLKHLMPEFISD